MNPLEVAQAFAGMADYAKAEEEERAKEEAVAAAEREAAEQESLRRIVNRAKTMRHLVEESGLSETLIATAYFADMIERTSGKK